MFKEVFRFVSERVGSSTAKHSDAASTSSFESSPGTTGSTLVANASPSSSSSSASRANASRSEDIQSRPVWLSVSCLDSEQPFATSMGTTRAYATLGPPSHSARSVSVRTVAGDSVPESDNTACWQTMRARPSPKRSVPQLDARGQERSRHRGGSVRQAWSSSLNVDGSCSNLGTATNCPSVSSSSTPSTMRSRKLVHADPLVPPPPPTTATGPVWSAASCSSNSSPLPSPSPSLSPSLRARSAQQAAECAATLSPSTGSTTPHGRPKTVTSFFSPPQTSATYNQYQNIPAVAAPMAMATRHSRVEPMPGSRASIGQDDKVAFWPVSARNVVCAPWTWTVTRSSENESEQERFTDSEHSAALLRRLRELAFGVGVERERLSLCDVTLVISNDSDERERQVRIAAHRVVLSAASEYFEALFSVEMRESHSREVRIGGVDGETMRQLVEYIYSGTIELREDSVERLLAAACRFRLDAAVSACSVFLVRRLQPANCVGIWQFAERHACEALRAASLRFCCERFPEMAVLEEFPLLAADELDKLLLSDELNVPDEESVYCALIRWLQHDLDGRLAHFPRLLRAVRLPLLNENFLLNEVDSNPVLQSSNDVLQLLVAALKHHVAKARDAEQHAAQVNAVMSAHPHVEPTTNQVPTNSIGCGQACRESRSKPRVCGIQDKRQCIPRRSMCGSLWIIGGVDSTNKCSLLVERLNYYSNVYETITQLPTRRLQFGAALLQAPVTWSWQSAHTPVCSPSTASESIERERFLLIVGGRDGLKTLSTVDAYDFARVTWQQMPAMATPRHGLGVAVLNSVLYAVGGHDGWSYLNTVERFVLSTRSWSYCSPLGVARSTCGVIACGQRLYAIGGRDGSACLRSVESFDPNSQKWTVCAPMNRRRGGVACAELNGFVYAVGGHDAPTNNPNAGRLDTVERYDPRTDQWCIVAPLGGPRDALAVGTIGGYLFAVGGFDGQTYLSNVQMFDDETDEWHDAPRLRTGRAGAVAVHVRHSHLPVCAPNGSDWNVHVAAVSRTLANSKRSSLIDVDANGSTNEVLAYGPAMLAGQSPFFAPAGQNQSVVAPIPTIQRQ